MTQTFAQPGATARYPSVGRWNVTALPAGWVYIDGFGVRKYSANAEQLVTNVGLGEDILEADDGLAAYIEKQMKLIGGYLKEPKLAGPRAIPFENVDEAQLLFVRHNDASIGVMLHAQTYVRLGLWVGVITLTTLEAQISVVRPDYDGFVKGLRIMPLPPGQAAMGAPDSHMERV